MSQLTDFEKAIESYVQAVDAADEKLEQIYKKADDFYQAGKLSEAHNTLLTYFMLDQEAHFRDVQMQSILFNVYGQVLDYCDVGSARETDKLSEFGNQIRCAYIDVANRLERTSNTQAYSLINRIDDDLSVIEANNPTMASQRAEGIKERKELVGAINEIASAGRTDETNQYVKALLIKAENLIADAYKTVTGLQDIVDDLKNKDKVATLSELEVLAMIHSLTEAYNTILTTEHLLLPALKANVWSLGAIEEHPEYEQYAIRLQGIKHRLDDVVKLTEKGIYMQISSQESDKPISVHLQFGKKNDEYRIRGLHDTIQGTKQFDIQKESAWVRTGLGVRNGSRVGLALNKKVSLVSGNTKTYTITSHSAAKGAQAYLDLELGPISMKVGLDALNREADNVRLMFNAYRISKSGSTEWKDLAKEAANDAAEKATEEIGKTIKGEELSEFDPEKIIGDVVKVGFGIDYNDRKREEARPVLQFNAKFSQLANPWTYLATLGKNGKNIAELLKNQKPIDVVQRIAVGATNFDHANLSDLMKAITPELQKLDHISPDIMVSEISPLLEQDRIAKEQEREQKQAEREQPSHKHTKGRTEIEGQTSLFDINNPNGTEDQGGPGDHEEFALAR